MTELFLLHDTSLLFSVVFRIVLSAILGAAIGIDRVRKRRPAGIKTHALVCMGAALVMVTDEYIWMQSGSTTSMTRMAAQVISGVGFLGAGTIMVTGRNQIKGLTTAAGLWFSACLGISIGCGFYVAALVSSFMVYVIVKVFAQFDTYLQHRSLVMDLYLEFSPTISIARLMAQIKKTGCVIIEMEKGHNITSDNDSNTLNVLLSIQLPKRKSHQEALEAIAIIDGVQYIEEV